MLKSVSASGPVFRSRVPGQEGQEDGMGGQDVAPILEAVHMEGDVFGYMPGKSRHEMDAAVADARTHRNRQFHGPAGGIDLVNGIRFEGLPDPVNAHFRKGGLVGLGPAGN